jgi:hypothetical protein
VSAGARVAVPLAARRLDLLFIGFFVLNLVVITYVVDLEQLVIADPAHFTYPVWPPAFMIDATHWWARTFDHLQWARPMWWKMTIWIDVLLFGPFYAAAVWAFAKGRDWIRIPSVIWASVMMTNVTIILGEEFFGPTATPAAGPMLLANAPWFLFPVLVLWRLGWTEHPFTRAR